MYNAKEIESKWQKYWADHEVFKAAGDSKKPKLYVLDMFPYPSGYGLHVGHSRIYTASDIAARYYRMQGYDVLHPMGWDAFGLPTENYAIKTGIQPRVSTEKNIINYKRQMSIQGFSYDWSREIDTTDPKYYKWTQWIFLKLFEKGLAYEAEVPINWCPSCKTGLANEEVIAGKCERCHTQVIRKNMRQWMLKITAYADRLLSGLSELEWPEKIKKMQENWIGRSEGASISFNIADRNETIEVFTTRPDTLFGATYMVLAPEHPLVAAVATPEQIKEIDLYIEASAKKSDLERSELQKDKTGVFTGGYAINPINNERIPIWIADYVLMGYGTGAIMAVPAHDQRDYDFAEKYKIPVLKVVVPTYGNDEVDGNLLFAEYGKLINSGKYNNLNSETAAAQIVNDLGKMGMAEHKINFKLRDWVFSRQRYWGEPIPIVHCEKCGNVAVPENELPLELPNVEKYEPTGTGESPLVEISDWVNTKCPKCGEPAKRETNTMPQWAGSSWYWLRFCDPNNNLEFASQKEMKYWMPVDIYVGGAEHAVLHLLYGRFWQMFLHDEGYALESEPFKNLKSVGMVLANAYKDGYGKYVHYDDIRIDGDTAFNIKTGEKLTAEVDKMSKSKGNVVTPDSMIEKYSADTLRVYSMFMGPWGEMCSFDLNGIEGSARFLKKVYSLLEKVGDEKVNDDTLKILNQSIKKVTEDIEAFRFNTAVSQLMILTNRLLSLKSVNKESLMILAKLLSPIAPHLAEELWSGLGNNQSIILSEWPKADISKVVEENVEIVVQVNGKVRAKFETTLDTSNEELLAKAKDALKNTEQLSGEVVKEIVVQNKLVSFVVK